MAKYEIEIDEDEFLPVYRHLLDPNDFDIEFLWGSRDSGKSRDIAQRMIMACLTEKYFLCPLIRKVQNTIKDSQWQMLKLVVENWGLDKYFDFNSSPLEIRCNLNKNKFLARGLDDPLKLKSLTNPSHAWIEEASDLTQEDWILILTSLRSDHGKTKVNVSFNPDVDGDYEENYMYKTFFAHTKELSFVNTLLMEVEMNGKVIQADLNYRVTHSTYKDNHYCSPQRAFQYESLKTSSPYEYIVYALGLWGRRITGGEFLKGFNIGVHTGITEADINRLMHISIDSNVFPYITTTCWQLYKDESLMFNLDQVNELLASDPNNTARRAGEMTGEWLRSINYNQDVWLYGDKSVKNKNNIDDDKRSFYGIYCDGLKKYGYTIVDRFSTYAPPVSAVGDFVNAILSGTLPICKIKIGTHCKKSITDYIETKQDIDGTILKKRVIDKVRQISYEPNGHITDTFKDLLVQMFTDEFNKHQNRFQKVIPGGVSRVRMTPKYTL